MLIAKTAAHFCGFRSVVLWVPEVHSSYHSVSKHKGKKGCREADRFKLGPACPLSIWKKKLLRKKGKRKNQNYEGWQFPTWMDRGKENGKISISRESNNHIVCNKWRMKAQQNNSR